MADQEAKLLLVCGKIASGKSTLLSQLQKKYDAILLSEDLWNSTLYPEELNSLEDYVKYSARVRQILTPHIITLLQRGVSIALDFPANTTKTRHWMKKLIDTANVEYELHYLSVPDDECKKRLWARNKAGEHQFTVTDEQFNKFTKYFQPPTPEESFSVILHEYETT